MSINKLNLFLELRSSEHEPVAPCEGGQNPTLTHSPLKPAAAEQLEQRECKPPALVTAEDGKVALFHERTPTKTLKCFFHHFESAASLVSAAAKRKSSASHAHNVIADAAATVSTSPPVAAPTAAVPLATLIHQTQFFEVHDCHFGCTPRYAAQLAGGIVACPSAGSQHNSWRHSSAPSA